MRTLTLVLALLTVCSAADAQSRRGPRDIVDTAVAAGSFETLAAALKAADLIDTLKGKGPFTVFAPTDAAFSKLPRGTVENLLKPENRGQLTAILLFHVVPGRLDSRQILETRSAGTVGGQRLAFDLGDGLKVEDAAIVQADVAASNGVIHVIDRVLLPSFDDIPTTAKSAGIFNTLLAAVNAAGLADTLAGQGPFTVFAPTDDAFAALPEGTVESLLEPGNRDRLVAILQYHVVAGRVFARDALQAGSATTLQGGSVTVDIGAGRLRVQGAGVLQTDIDASNGVVHVIDAVLLPPEPARRGRLLVGISYEHPDARLRKELGLERGEGIVITGVTRGLGAAAAGLRRDDVIVRVDGGPATLESLKKAKERRGEGGTVDLTVVRRVGVEVSRDSH